MNEFKLGDEVKILGFGKCVGYAGCKTIGDTGFITNINSLLRNVLLDGDEIGSGSWINVGDLELVTTKYPNPPHKHCDLQIEKARGANIQYLSQSGNWRAISDPSWFTDDIYRVAPTEKELADIKTQAKIDKYLAKIEKLKLTLEDV